MEIKLTNTEAETFFHNALCNGLGQINGYGIDVNYSDKDYTAARKKLSKSTCYEDVLLQILKDGNKLQFVDEEEGQDTVTILLADVYAKMPLVPFDHLTAMIEENDDADTADVILQTIIYGEIIFG